MLNTNAQKAELKESLKTTSLFGGVQIFSIIVSVLRNKVVALLIGPAGVGLITLYTSTLTLITSLTDFSLQVSAVRDVSLAYNNRENKKFRHTIAVFSRIVWFTGLLGTIVCLCGSPFWSKLTFETYDYTLGFVVLSIVLLLQQLQNGKNVILQGTLHYRYLAVSGFIGNIVGLLTTIPIYYFWGVDGIVLVLLLSAFTSFALPYYFVNKLGFTYENISLFSAIKEGINMLKQGFALSINFFLSSLVFYIIRAFITKQGGVSELGLYAASYAIVNGYIGLIFQSMAKEYYPRLCAISSNNIKMGQKINNQIYLTLLIVGPLIIIFLIFSDIVLVLLYSEKFKPASLLMALSMVGILFQTPAWCISHSFLAKGDNKFFLVFETFSKFSNLLLDIIFYIKWGLVGLGISFILGYFLYLLQNVIVCKKKYRYIVDLSLCKLFSMWIFVVFVALFLVIILSTIYRLIFGTLIIFLVLCYSYVKLNKIIDVNSSVKKICNKLYK